MKKSKLSIKFWISFILALGFCNLSSAKQFKVYWNIPSFMCKQHQISITNNITKQFGILQNEDDNFRGNQIAILYDPGNFPAILQNSLTKKFVYRNHGVPQEGNLTDHLTVFEKHINELIPDKSFNGLAIIDFESWRPNFRQNFGTLQPYRDLSVFIERNNHPSWIEKRLHKEASRRFEEAAKIFMENTIALARKLRPNASWGYYAFPYCFNGRNNNIENCADGVIKENNGIQWLFDSSDIVLPSVYLSEKIPVANRIRMVRGRIAETQRLIQREKSKLKSKIYVYHRYVYTDTLNYLSESDTYGVLNEIRKSSADGIILWGSSNDLNTRKKCEEFHSYLMNTLGPVVSSLQPVFSATLND